MALRTINYAVTVSDISPKACQFGGIQGERNATDIIFNLDTALVTAIATEKTTLETESGEIYTLAYRVDLHDGAGGYYPSESLVPVNNKITYSLENTSVGGVVTLYLIISLIDAENMEKVILYSYPANIKIASSSQGTPTNSEILQNISGAVAEARAEAGRATEQAELTGATAELERKESESSRISNESDRVSSEITRESSESDRIIAESSRASSEFNRNNAEITRISSESNRVSAELTREQKIIYASSLAIGTIQPFAGVVEPLGTMFTKGQTVSRTAYTSLFNIITFLINVVTMASGSASVTVSNTSELYVGEIIEGNGIQATTTILSITDSTHIVLSKTATATATTGTIRVFPFGNGNGSTTFTIPKGDGNVIVGRDVTQTEFNALGKTGGAKTHSLTANQNGAHVHDLGIVNPSLPGETGYRPPWVVDKAFTAYQATGSSGLGEAHNNLQPYLVSNYIIIYAGGISQATIDASLQGAKDYAAAQDVINLASAKSYSDAQDTAHNTSPTAHTDKFALKANIAQEAWITPTLLNGAVNNGTVPVQYMKDNFGFVHFKGKLTSGTSAMSQFTMPVGYRPLSTLYFFLPQIGAATAGGRCDISSAVILYSATTGFDFSVISYKAES